MCKYTKEIMLEEEPFKTIRFKVVDCDTREEADKELKQWLKDYPELTKQEVNQKIIAMVLKK